MSDRRKQCMRFKRVQQFFVVTYITSYIWGVYSNIFIINSAKNSYVIIKIGKIYLFKVPETQFHILLQQKIAAPVSKFSLDGKTDTE